MHNVYGKQPCMRNRMEKTSLSRTKMYDSIIQSIGGLTMPLQNFLIQKKMHGMLMSLNL